MGLGIDNSEGSPLQEDKEKAHLLSIKAGQWLWNS